MATTGCNCSCANCQNYQISQARPDDVPSQEVSPEQLVDLAIKNKCQSIAFTYTEPLTYYEYTYDTAKLAREKGIRNVLVSGGYVNEKPLRDLCKYLDAANIDLKAFDESFYKQVSHGHLQPVLDSLKVIKEEGVWLEITNLIIPTLNDSDEMIRAMCEWLVDNGFKNIPLHFSRFHPTYKMNNLPITPLETLIKARDIARNCGIEYVYLGNAPYAGEENTLCPICNHMLIEREGFRIIENNLRNRRCPECGEIIAGIWD